MGSITSSGSTVVTANYGRFRKRMAMGIIGALLVIVAVVVSLVTFVGGRLWHVGPVMWYVKTAGEPAGCVCAVTVIDARACASAGVTRTARKLIV